MDKSFGTAQRPTLSGHRFAVMAAVALTVLMILTPIAAQAYPQHACGE
jgi:hypothetical protein